MTAKTTDGNGFEQSKKYNGEKEEIKRMRGGIKEVGKYTAREKEKCEKVDKSLAEP